MKNLLMILSFVSILCGCYYYGEPGSGLGSVATLEHYTYEGKYYAKYADIFLLKFPQYKVPIEDTSLASGYEFLNMTKFYFDKTPKEIYCVQWEGTGFIEVRLAYSIDKRKDIIENKRDNLFVDESEKQRIGNRLRHEIIDKIDSIINSSEDRQSVI